MKKILLLFLTIFICYSCEIQYDGETRIVVQGQVIDKNNNPISDKRVEINTYSDGTFVGSDLISYTNTDAEGKFTLVFPAPKGEDIDIVTTINGNYYIDYNSTQDPTSNYQSKNVYALKKNFINYKLDLNKIVLYKKDEITQLDVVLNKTTNNKEITEINVEGNLAANTIALNNDDEIQHINTHFDVLKNQNLKLSYTIKDYSNPTNVVTTTQEAIITINSEKVIHTITY